MNVKHHFFFFFYKRRVEILSSAAIIVAVECAFGPNNGCFTATTLVNVIGITEKGATFLQLSPALKVKSRIKFPSLSSLHTNIHIYFFFLSLALNSSRR